MRVLLWLFKKNRVWVSLSLFAGLISNTSQIVYLFFVGELVNKIEARSRIELSFFLILGAFLLSNALTQYVYQLVGRYTTERMAHTLRMGFIRSKIHQPARKIEADSAAHVMSVVQNELSAANDYLTNTFFDMVGMSFSGILVFVFLVFVNVRLTMVILIPTILTMVYVTLSGKKLSVVVSATLDEKKHMNRIAYSSIENYAVLKVFDAKLFLQKIYERSLNQWSMLEAKKDRLYAIFNSLSGVLSRIPLLLLLFMGGLMVLSGEILLGTLILFLNLQKNVTQFIMNLPMWIARFKTFTVNLERIDVGLKP